MGLHEKLDVLADEGLLAPSEVDGLPEYRQYLHQSRGVQFQDIWAYQPYTKGVLVDSDEPIDFDVRWPDKRGGTERMGYPTQKPEGILHRAIKASCPEGGTILDPFLGGGTTVIVAEELKRKWIGIDVTVHAINMTVSRLKQHFGDGITKLIFSNGLPRSIAAAERLAEIDKYSFQAWAVARLGIQSTPKGSDRGVDGVGYFRDDESGKFKKIIAQVKGGGVTSGDVRDITATMDREKAELGGFVCFKTPTKDMKADAIATGFYSPGGIGQKKVPRCQIITVAELLEGRGLEFPSQIVETTHAPVKRKAILPTQPSLLL